MNEVKQIAIRTDKETRLQFRHLCENHDSSVQQVISNFVNTCLKNRGIPKELINQAEFN